jgi:hypothetical protein
MSPATRAWKKGRVMDQESSRIVGAIVHVSRKSGALASSDADVTARAIRVACAAWEEGARGFVTPELKDTAPWAAYEMNVLQLGRALDLVIRKLGCWKGRGPVLDAAADVMRDARFGRGRQSFTATVGEHGEGAYGQELASLLADEVMAGYAMKALHRGGNGDYVALVRSASATGRPWVQMAARAYLASFDTADRAPASARAADERAVPLEEPITRMV